VHFNDPRLTLISPPIGLGPDLGTGPYAHLDRRLPSLLSDGTDHRKEFLWVEAAIVLGKIDALLTTFNLEPKFSSKISMKVPLAAGRPVSSKKAQLAAELRGGCQLCERQLCLPAWGAS
jgi:hypothetical protein